MFQLPFFEGIETALSITGHVGNLWILRGQGHLVPEKKKGQRSTRVHTTSYSGGPNLGPQTGYTEFYLFIPVTPGAYRYGTSNQTKNRCRRILFNNADSNSDSMASDGTMLMDREVETMWNEAVMARRGH
jgi:hypothetical protein